MAAALRVQSATHRNPLLRIATCNGWWNGNFARPWTGIGDAEKNRMWENVGYLESLYTAYRRDEHSVPPEWRHYFAEQGNGEGGEALADESSRNGFNVRFASLDADYQPPTERHSRHAFHSTAPGRRSGPDRGAPDDVHCADLRSPPRRWPGSRPIFAAGQRGDRTARANVDGNLRITANPTRGN